MTKTIDFYGTFDACKTIAKFLEILSIKVSIYQFLDSCYILLAYPADTVEDELVKELFSTLQDMYFILHSKVSHKNEKI